jgi:hypothetical protein
MSKPKPPKLITITTPSGNDQEMRELVEGRGPSAETIIEPPANWEKADLLMGESSFAGAEVALNDKKEFESGLVRSNLMQLVIELPIAAADHRPHLNRNLQTGTITSRKAKRVLELIEAGLKSKETGTTRARSLASILVNTLEDAYDRLPPELR